MSRTKCEGSVNKESWNNLYEPDVKDDAYFEKAEMSIAEISEINITKKNRMIMEQVISVHHPLFNIEGPFRSAGLNDPDMFNITRLVEQSLAAIGPYDFINAYGYDFTDYSDSKTATVSQYNKMMTIGNVQNKIGALRVTAYNPYTNTLDYFYLPKNVVDECKEKNKTVKNPSGERIRTTWNIITNHYNTFEPHRVKTFNELAFAGHEQMIVDQADEISDTSFSVSDIESVNVSSKQTKMKVTKQYTIEELNKMSAQVAKKKATAQGIPRTSHPPQSELTHPICITPSCTNPKTVNDWHWTSGLPVYKDICIKCHNKAVAGKHGLTRISQVVAKNKATEKQKSNISYSTS